MDDDRHYETPRPIIGERVTAALGGLVLLGLGMFCLLFIITGDFRVSAAIELTVLAVLLFVGVGFGGAFVGAKISTEIQRGKAEARADVLDAPARPSVYLPDPGDALIRVDDTLMVRRQQIEAAAEKVYIHLWPHTQPTRSNIQDRFPALRSAGFVGAVQGYLKERGLAEGGGQGREYTWVVRDE